MMILSLYHNLIIRDPSGEKVIDFAKAGLGKGPKLEDLDILPAEMDMYVDLHPITNTSPYSVVETMSLAKAPVTFRELGHRRLCVVPKTPGVEYELRERFRSCGEILRIFVVPDKITGRPKEVAFITFADRESVYKALRQSGSIIGGSAITVEVEQGRSRGVARKKVNEMTEGQSNTVVVSGFTVISGFGVVKNELRERFKSRGEILRIFVVPDKITGRPKDVAFITFADRECVFKALLQSGYIIGGSAITVEVGRSFVD